MTETVTQFWKATTDRIAAPQDVPEADNLREFWLAARRQTWLVLLFAMAGLALGAFHFATSPARYYASSTILIEEMQSDLDQEISSLRPLSRNDTGFQNQFQILRSRQVAGEVVRDLELHKAPDFITPPRSMLGQIKADIVSVVKALLPRPAPTPAAGRAPAPSRDDAAIQEAAALLVSQTNFHRLGKSYSVEVGFLSHDPALATDIANAYARAYLADGTRTNLEASDRTAAWMEQRIADVRQSAIAASEEAERFRAANRATDQQGLREREQRVDALNELLLALEARYQEHLLAGSFPVANGRVLSAALLPDEPSKPVAWQLLLAGLAVGAILGVAVAVMRELRETGFRTGDDVKAVGLTFLGYLPELLMRDRKVRDPSEENTALVLEAKHEVKMGVSAGGRARPRIKLESPSVQVAVEDRLTLAASDAPYGRAARGILWTVDMSVEEGKARVLGVSGLARGEGATTLASNLAEQAAEHGGRVLLIDSDFGSGDLTSRIGSGSEAADAAPSELEPLRDVRRLRSNVHVLPAHGQAVPLSSRVAAIRAAINAAASTYDLVIVDMPPVTHPDAGSLLRSLDGILMVIHWGRTSRGSVEAFLGRSSDVRRKLIGAVLNQTRLSGLGRYGVPNEECRELLGARR